jgi:hypothetical protein
MDPTAALAHMREHIANARQAEKDGKVEDELLELNALAEHFEGLDHWMVAGGFLPNQWGLTRHSEQMAAARS